MLSETLQTLQALRTLHACAQHISPAYPWVTMDSCFAHVRAHGYQHGIPKSMQRRARRAAFNSVSTCTRKVRVVAGHVCYMHGCVIRPRSTVVFVVFSLNIT